MYNRRTKRSLDRRTLNPSVSQLNSAIRHSQQNVIGPGKLTGVLGNLTRRQLSSPASTTVGRWFKLTSVAANPMTGYEATFAGASWAQKSDASATDVYVYPQLDITHYAANDYVYAISIDDYWVSLYNFPVALDIC